MGYFFCCCCSLPSDFSKICYYSVSIWVAIRWPGFYMISENCCRLCMWRWGRKQPCPFTRSHIGRRRLPVLSPPLWLAVWSLRRCVCSFQHIARLCVNESGFETVTDSKTNNPVTFCPCCISLRGWSLRPFNTLLVTIERCPSASLLSGSPALLTCSSPGRSPSLGQPERAGNSQARAHHRRVENLSTSLSFRVSSSALQPGLSLLLMPVIAHGLTCQDTHHPSL